MVATGANGSPRDVNVPNRRSSRQIHKPVVLSPVSATLEQRPPADRIRRLRVMVWCLLAPLVACVWYAAFIHRPSKTSSPTLDHIHGVLLLPGLIPTLALTVAAPYLTYRTIEATKDAFLRKGFGGRDLLKGGPEPIPETLGLPTSIVYCMLMCCYIPYRYSPHSTPSAGIQRTLLGLSNSDGGWNGEMAGQSGFPHHELSSYLSSLMSILSSILLGFIDDVFDIRWRLKMPIPLLASLPMLVVYQAGSGGTAVVVPGWPTILRRLVGASIINLGPLYHLFILLLSTFSVHSINILAGINGVEVGQALIIGLSLCCNDLLYLDPRAGQPGSFASLELRDRHMFSLALLMPFCGCCLGLLAWNKYPARVFVGDTFCYFAGQVLACAGVLGHFSKTLLLFFVPQLINFALSLPQIGGLVPCPRHRVPKVDLNTKRLHPSQARFDNDRQAGTLATWILQLLSALHLVHLEWTIGDKQTPRRIASTTNLTILNAILVLRGVKPLVEESDKGALAQVGPAIDELSLWWHMMLFQALCSTLAFAVRYKIAAIVFPQ